MSENSSDQPGPDVVDRLLDGDLSRAERADALRHIAGDPLAREDFAALKDLASQFDDPLATPDLRDSVLADVERVRPFMTPRWRRVVSAGRLSVAAACLLLAAGVAYVRQHHPEFTVEPQSPEHFSAIEQAAQREIAEPIEAKIEAFINNQPGEELSQRLQLASLADEPVSRGSVEFRTPNNVTRLAQLRVVHTEPAASPDAPRPRVTLATHAATDLPIAPELIDSITVQRQSPVANVTIRLHRSSHDTIFFAPISNGMTTPTLNVQWIESDEHARFSGYRMITSPLADPAISVETVIETSDEVSDLFDLEGID